MILTKGGSMKKEKEPKELKMALIAIEFFGLRVSLIDVIIHYWVVK